MANKKPISVTLDEGLLSSVDRLCADADRNRSWFIERAVAMYLEELADLEEALALANDPPENFISEEQLINDLDL